MSLTSLDELHAKAPPRAGAPELFYERVLLRIHDAQKPMPPRGRPQLTPSELSTLARWLKRGAPGGDACPSARGGMDRESSVDEPTAMSGDASVERASADARAELGDSAAEQSEPDAGQGSDVEPESEPPPAAGEPADVPTVTTPPPVPDDVPVRPDDSECTFFELRARKDPAGAPFQVGENLADSYHCFVFDLAFSAPTQALAFYAILDNVEVLHHWLLYTADSVDASSTEIFCDGFVPDSVLVAGWAPGAGDWYLPRDVGFELGRGRFILEMHYNNIDKPATTDRSGVKICATQALRKHTATVSWLGNQTFSIPPRSVNYAVDGSCRPRYEEPIHILRSWPHMHRLGRRMTMDVNRADGTSAMIFDVPFSFDSQRQYDTPLLLQPGDTLSTTCYFDNPTDRTVQLGENTTDEMCHNFVVAYPANALDDGVINIAANNTCVGLF